MPATAWQGGARSRWCPEKVADSAAPAMVDVCCVCVCVWGMQQRGAAGEMGLLIESR